MYVEIAERTGVDKSWVAAVFKSFAAVVDEELFAPSGSRTVEVPELGVKLINALRPPTEARPGRNPHTGAAIVVAAKPARWKLRARFLKRMKEGLALTPEPQ